MAKAARRQWVDFYDYVPRAAQSPEPAQQRGRAPISAPADIPIHITDDWLDIIPVNEAELRAVEGHLGDVLDKLFGKRP